MKRSFKIFLSLILFFCSQISIAMDKTKMHQKKMVHFCLMDEKKCYNLSFCKVRKSRFLLAAYHADRKKFPFQACRVHIAGISQEEMSLFDKSPDADIKPKSKNSFSDYFQKTLNSQQRRVLTVAAGEYDENGLEKLDIPFLRAQLADEWINHASDLGRKHIMPCFSDLITYCKFAMIKESVEQKKAISSDPYIYVSDEMRYQNPAQVDTKICDGGGCLYLPLIEGLDQEGFRAKFWASRFIFKGEQHAKMAQTCRDNEKGYFVLVKLGSDLSKIEIVKKVSFLQLEHMKTIDHSPYRIDYAWLSPDRKLLITKSENPQGGQGLFLMTNLDDSKPEDFLLDTPYDCFKDAASFCFNHTSDVLACVQQRAIIFFDLISKKEINSLPLHASLTPTMKTGIDFNRDSSRLVFYFSIGRSCFIEIYDTSDLSNIKQIGFFCKDNIDEPLSLNVDFSYASQQAFVSSGNDEKLHDLIIISGANITLFFDGQSGKLLGQKISEKGLLSYFKKDYVINHGATLPIPNSPTTFIGIDYGTSSAVSLCNHINGKEIGTIEYPEPKILGIGFTKNLASLIAIFKNNKTIKTDFFDNQKFQAILNGMRFVDWYVWYQLYFAEKSKIEHNVPSSWVDYIKEIFNSGNMNNFIEEHFLTHEKNSWAHYFGFSN